MIYFRTKSPVFFFHYGFSTRAYKHRISIPEIQIQWQDNFFNKNRMVYGKIYVKIKKKMIILFKLNFHNMNTFQSFCSKMAYFQVYLSWCMYFKVQDVLNSR